MPSAPPPSPAPSSIGGGGGGGDGGLVLGVTARPLGGFPSAWRIPGAHADPDGDPRVLVALARSAERAGLDFIFLGDWFSTSVELVHTDPHLLARTEPLTTAGFLAAATKRIGIIATVGAAYADPFTTARATASLDRLSGGRFGVNLVVGVEPRASLNHGRRGLFPVALTAAEATEYVEVLRGLWDSWSPDAFVTDREGGALLSPDPVRSLGHRGREYTVAGPLSVLRPVQGHVPLVHAGSSPRAREFAATEADIHLVDPADLVGAVASATETRALATAAGRRASGPVIVAPLLPIVAERVEDAWAVYDRLVDLLAVEDDGVGSRAADRRPDGRAALPSTRSTRHLLRAVGLPLADHRADDVVSASAAERFNPTGTALLALVTARSGRMVGGARPVTYRHLLAASTVPAPLVVGTPETVADHIELWHRSGAVDGFTIISAYLPEQSDVFLEQVVPVLRDRGLRPARYRATTLRGHLGSAVPPRGDRRASVLPLGDRSAPIGARRGTG